MARRSDHTRDELKDIILSASWDIVKKDGFAGLTARHIAKDINYAAGTIYNVFPAMDDLYLAVNGMTLDKLYAVLSSPDCTAHSAPPIQNIKKMAHLYRDFTKTYKPHWLMLFTYTLPDGKKAPEWYQAKVTRLFAPLETLLKPYYTQKPDRHRKMAARILWASVHGLCFLEETGKTPLITPQDSLSEMTGYLIDCFVAGIESK